MRRGNIAPMCYRAQHAMPLRNPLRRPFYKLRESELRYIFQSPVSPVLAELGDWGTPHSPAGRSVERPYSPSALPNY